VSYNKLISYGKSVELFEYEKTPQRFGRKYQKLQDGSKVRRVAENRADLLQRKSQSTKRRDNARRSGIFFRKLVASNLGVGENPLYVTLTIAKNVCDVGKAHGYFNAFARSLKNQFGTQVRYIAVPEFQKRGAVHFHALFWGLETEQLARTERHSRLFAKTWGVGFADLVATDGSIKLAWYLGKYMLKAILDPRLLNKKAFIASRNIVRPLVQKDVLLEPLFIGGVQVPVDLSTASCLQDKTYMTQWLGKGRFRYYELRN